MCRNMLMAHDINSGSSSSRSNIVEDNRNSQNLEKETIHSGHFMVSEFEADAQDDEYQVAVPVPDTVCLKKFEIPFHRRSTFNSNSKANLITLNDSKLTSNTSGSRALTSCSTSLSIETSLTKLFQCMSIAYRQKLTSPKWNRFKGVRLRWKDKIRLNNVIWRCWHMQFVIKKNIGACQFACPLDVDIHSKPEAVVLEGKYWKRKLNAVTAEYKKWRLFYRNQLIGSPPKSPPQYSLSDLMQWNFIAGSQTASAMAGGNGSAVGSSSQSQSLMMNSQNENIMMMMMDDQDYMQLMSDTLFSTTQPPAFNCSHYSHDDVAHHRGGSSSTSTCLADFIQPSLVQLQPNLDDFMDTLEPLHSLLSSNASKLPSVPEEYQSSSPAAATDDDLCRSLIYERPSPHLALSPSSSCSVANSTTDLSPLSLAPKYYYDNGKQQSDEKRQQTLTATNEVVDQSLSNTNNNNFSYDRQSNHHHHRGTTGFYQEFTTRNQNDDGGNNNSNYTSVVDHRIRPNDNNNNNNQNNINNSSCNYSVPVPTAPAAVAINYSATAHHQTYRLVDDSNLLVAASSNADFTCSSAAQQQTAALSTTNNNSNNYIVVNSKSTNEEANFTSLPKFGRSRSGSSLLTVTGGELQQQQYSHNLASPHHHDYYSPNFSSAGLLTQLLTTGGGDKDYGYQRYSSSKAAAGAQMTTTVSAAAVITNTKKRNEDSTAGPIASSYRPVAHCTALVGRRSRTPDHILSGNANPVGYCKPRPASLLPASQSDGSLVNLSTSNRTRCTENVYSLPSSSSSSPSYHHHHHNHHPKHQERSSSSSTKMVAALLSTDKSSTISSSKQNRQVLLTTINYQQQHQLPTAGNCLRTTNNAFDLMSPAAAPISMLPQHIDPSSVNNVAAALVKTPNHHGGAVSLQQESSSGTSSSIVGRPRQTANTYAATVSGHLPPSSFKPPKTITTNSTSLSSSRFHKEDRRRVCHINAEQKRRCNIKNGFDTLHMLIPHLIHNPNTKMSKAAMLQKGAEYIRQLRSERTQLKDEIESLRQQVESLNSAISQCLAEPPNQFCCIAAHRPGAHYKLSLICEPLLASFNSTVSTASVEELFRTTIQWAEQYCSLVDLRPVVLNALRQLCTTTEILSDPNRLPDEVRKAVCLLDQRNIEEQPLPPSQ